MNGGRGAAAPALGVIAWALGAVAVYVAVFGAATSMLPVTGWGIGLLTLAVILAVISVVWAVASRRLVHTWISGMAHVVAASQPPLSEPYGRCELQAVISAPGLPSARVTIRDRLVPVTKWPEVGATLPILVAIDDVRRVRIRWDQIRPEAPVQLAGRSEEPDQPTVLSEEPDEFAGLSLDEQPLPGPRWVLPLEEEASALVARYLFPMERFRGEWRRHWVRPFRVQAVMLVSPVLGIAAARQWVDPQYVSEASAGVCALGALVSVHAILAWLVGRFVLTNKRVMLVEGVFQRRVAMMPLLRVTDMRYEQSPFGRLLDYGAFAIEDARAFSPIGRIADLPNPNELYLRLVEEMYEPAAVEARLGRQGHDDDDSRPWRTETVPPRPTETETLKVAIREAIYGPALTNYDGWVSVEVLDGEHRLPVSEDRRVRLEPGRSYELRVMIAPDPAAGTAEPLVVTGGVDREVVEFTAEVDSDQRALRRPGQPITVGGETPGLARFVIQVPDEEVAAPPWLWVRVSQYRRLLQSIELVATRPAALEQQWET